MAEYGIGRVPADVDRGAELLAEAEAEARDDAVRQQARMARGDSPTERYCTECGARRSNGGAMCPMSDEGEGSHRFA